MPRSESVAADLVEVGQRPLSSARPATGLTMSTYQAVRRPYFRTTSASIAVVLVAAALMTTGCAAWIWVPGPISAGSVGTWASG